MVRSSRALVADTIGAAENILARGDELTEEHRRSLRLAATKFATDAWTARVP